ncbi:unnamed protein product, partial [marine sediment metagenome]
MVVNDSPDKITVKKVKDLIMFLIQLGITDFTYRRRLHGGDLYGRIAASPGFLSFHDAGTEDHSIVKIRESIKKLEPESGDAL